MRLFIGVPIPMEIGTPLARVAQALPQPIRPMRPEDMHITLSFLGEVSEERVPCIVSGLASVQRVSFDVSLEGLGTFPGVVFAQVGDSPSLHALAADVVTCMKTCGFAPERRAYHPHVTVARSRDRRGQPPEQWPGLLRFTAESFVLYRSQIGAQGARYQRLRTFPMSK